MPYALSNLVDGQKPSWHYIADNSEAGAGEVVVQARPTETQVWDAATSSLMTATAVQALSYAKNQKEAQLRDAADDWYEREVRGFEGVVIAAKYGRGTPLSAEEQAVFTGINTQYAKLKDLITQVRAATTLAQVDAIRWQA